MAEKLRLIDASTVEGSQFDAVVGFIHDVFHTHIHSAIGSSFTAFVAAAFMVMIAEEAAMVADYISLLA